MSLLEHGQILLYLLNVSRSYCLVASGLDSDVRVARASNIVKFYCIDANSNVEWILTGQT